MAKAKEKVLTYEALYEILQSHLEKLESGNLTLDESLALYQEAMEVAEKCQLQLKNAQEKLLSIENPGEK